MSIVKKCFRYFILKKELHRKIKVIAAMILFYCLFAGSFLDASDDSFDWNLFLPAILSKKTHDTNDIYLNLIVVNSATESAYESNSWEKTIKFKQNDIMQVFEVAIWNNGIHTNPKKISLYKFDKTFSPLKDEYINGGQAWVDYRESFNILDVSVPEPSSKMNLEAFKIIMRAIIKNQPAKHYGVKYQGHGSGGGDAPLFGYTLLEEDAELFLSYICSLIGKKIDFLDWNTNCGYGRYQVVRSQYKYADYILASDLERGGYSLGQDGTYEDIQLEHTQCIETFFSGEKSIRQSLIDMINSERLFWERVLKNDMISKQLKQSISIYDSDYFEELITSTDLEGGIQSGDVLNYIRSNYPEKEQKYYDFRFHYISNKDFFLWDVDSNGLIKSE